MLTTAVRPFERLERLAHLVGSCSSLQELKPSDFRRVMEWPRLTPQRVSDLGMLMSFAQRTAGTSKPSDVAVCINGLGAYMRSQRTSADLAYLGRQRSSYNFQEVVALCERIGR
jgi:hypothetical protein